MVSDKLKHALRYVKKMTVKQQHRYLYLLIEQERHRQQNGDLKNYKPKWWPDNVKYHHPMYRDMRFVVGEWKHQLYRLFKRFFKVHPEYLFSTKLAKCVMYKTGRSLSSEFSNVIQIEQKVCAPAPQDDARIRIQEKTIKLILNEPKIVLYDVVKYGEIGRFKGERELSGQENFLLNLQLIKTGKTPRGNKSARSFRYSKAKANVRIQTLGRNGKFRHYPNVRSTDTKSIGIDDSTKLHKELHELLKTLTKENQFGCCRANLKTIEHGNDLVKTRYCKDLQHLSTTNTNCKIDYFVSDCQQSQNRESDRKMCVLEQISKSLSPPKTNTSNQCVPCYVRLYNTH